MTLAIGNGRSNAYLPAKVKVINIQRCQIKFYHDKFLFKLFHESSSTRGRQMKVRTHYAIKYQA